MQYLLNEDDPVVHLFVPALLITTIICTATPLCFRSTKGPCTNLNFWVEDSGFIWCPIRFRFWEYFGFAPYTEDNILYKIKVRALGRLMIGNNRIVNYVWVCVNRYYSSSGSDLLLLTDSRSAIRFPAVGKKLNQVGLGHSCQCLGKFHGKQIVSC